MSPFLPGDQVKVIDGTFVGMVGQIIDPEEAHAMWEKVGGEKPGLTDPKGKLWVVLPVFGRPVPILLEPFQLEAMESRG